MSIFSSPVPGNSLAALCLFMLCTWNHASAAQSSKSTQPETLSASDTIQLLEVTITGGLSTRVRRTGEALFTGTALNEQGLQLSGISGKGSVYHSMDLLPGIAVEGPDAYGLSEKSVRMRGIRSSFSGMTIEGFPNYGIMPIGARDNLYDMENMNSLSVYKGASPADLGTATGSKGGAIDLRFRPPSATFRAKVDQSLGAHNYRRSFLRIDPGKAGKGPSSFLSASLTEAEKWKGPGTLGPRWNLALGLHQDLGPLELSFYANYNDMERHAYRELSYEQIQDRQTLRQTDFNRERNGQPSEDRYYYNYHRGSYNNRDLLFTARLNQNAGYFQLKAYHSTEDAQYYETVQRGPNFFRDTRSRKIHRLGLLPEWRRKTGSLEMAAGYWLERFDNNAQVYNSRITPDGLTPIGYGSYSVNKTAGFTHSPYAKLAHQGERLKIQAGLKYFHYTDPATERYPSASPDRLAEAPNPHLYTRKMQYGAWLPSLGLGYRLNLKNELYLNYGRTYMRPYMYSPVIALYVNNQDAFKQAGMVLQDIFDGWKMETSDNLDLGWRRSGEILSFMPTLYFARHHNVLAAVYDPEVGLNYLQNAGTLHAWGLEVETYLRPIKSLTLLFSPAYTAMEYQNELTRNGVPIGIKGKQAPATPRFSLKSGVFGKLGTVDYHLMARHTGSRFGDATNQEKISAYTRWDAGFYYLFTSPGLPFSLRAGAEAANLLDTTYVGAINSSDDSQQGAATYFAGAPRTITLLLSLLF